MGKKFKLIEHCLPVQVCSYKFLFNSTKGLAVPDGLTEKIQILPGKSRKTHLLKGLERTFSILGMALRSWGPGSACRSL